MDIHGFKAIWDLRRKWSDGPLEVHTIEDASLVGLNVVKVELNITYRNTGEIKEHISVELTFSSSLQITNFLMVPRTAGNSEASQSMNPVNIGIMSMLTGELMTRATRMIDFKIVAIANDDLGIAEKFIENSPVFAQGGPLCKAMTNDALISHEEVEAIYFHQPLNFRNEWIRKAITAGKHIYSEKPMGGTVAEFKALLDECEAKGVQFMDDTMWYHSTRTLHIEKLLGSGELGSIRTMNAAFTFRFPDQAWLEGGNRITDKGREPMGCLGVLGWYPLSAILWAFSWELPEHVIATSTTLNKLGTIVACSGVLFFNDGRVANFDCGCMSAHRSHYEIVCDRGSIRVDDFVGGQGDKGDHSAYFIPFLGSSNFTKADVNGKETIIEVEASCHVRSIVDNFAFCLKRIREGGKPEQDWPKRSLAVQTTLSAVFESAANGGRKITVADDR